jgi:hypothetical protein
VCFKCYAWEDVEKGSFEKEKMLEMDVSFFEKEKNYHLPSLAVHPLQSASTQMQDVRGRFRADDFDYHGDQ